jgi:hypothetical protein
MITIIALVLLAMVLVVELWACWLIGHWLMDIEDRLTELEMDVNNLESKGAEESVAFDGK